MVTYVTGLYGTNKRYYIRSKNIVIMLNPTADVIKLMEDEIKKNYRVHIFITSPYIFNEEWEKNMDRLTDWAKYYIHIPKTLADIKIIADEYINRLTEHKVIRSILEKNGPIFSTPFIRGRVGRYPIKVSYNKDHIDISLKLGCESFGDYYIKNGGAIRTSPMRVNPNLFKDKIIENFKQSCPEAILKAFKDDEDIWNYITQNAEWSFKEE